MRHSSEALSEPRDGMPWFRIKSGLGVYHLRIPGIASATRLFNYYRSIVEVVNASSRAAEDASKRFENASDIEVAKAAAESLEDAQRDMYGCLGFVLLSCWRDPDYELIARSAWLESYPIRSAIKDGLPLEAFDPVLLKAVKQAKILEATHSTDLRTAFGLLAWDEMLETGFSHEGIQEIAQACARYVFESIKSKKGSGIEIIADF